MNKNDEQFYKIPLNISEAMRTANLTATEYELYFFIREKDPYFDRPFRINSAELAEQLNLSRRTIQRSLAKLQNIGVISWEVEWQTIGAMATASGASNAESVNFCNEVATASGAMATASGAMATASGAMATASGAMATASGASKIENSIPESLAAPDFEAPSRASAYARYSLQTNTDLIQTNTDNIEKNTKKELSVAFAPPIFHEQEGESLNLANPDFSENMQDSEPTKPLIPEIVSESFPQGISTYQELTVSKKTPKSKPPKPQESDWLNFVEIYNALKPPSWAKCTSLGNDRLKALKPLVKLHGENTLIVWEKGLKFAAQDKWYGSVTWGFTNYVRHVTSLAEKWDAMGSKDDSFAREYDRIRKALD